MGLSQAKTSRRRQSISVGKANKSCRRELTKREREIGRDRERQRETDRKREREKEGSRDREGEKQGERSEIKRVISEEGQKGRLTRSRRIKSDR